MVSPFVMPDTNRIVCVSDPETLTPQCGDFWTRRFWLGLIGTRRDMSLRRPGGAFTARGEFRLNPFVKWFEHRCRDDMGSQGFVAAG
jgi:hypothetical protein